MSRPRNNLLRRICCLVAVILVVSILYVAVAPSLRLAPSALRAIRAAMAVLSCVCLWLSVVSGTVSAAVLECGVLGWARRRRMQTFGKHDLQALYCVCLC